MKYVRYSGEFVSVAGVIWRADIMQEADQPFTPVGELEFDADQPLVIDWPEKSKEQVLCGSVASLRIVSPGDRTYEDLYSVKVGRIRLDVYRNNTLYWSGAMDTEFYEEPYESASGYTVPLTFSDFGVLDRLKFARTGILNLEELVRYALGRSGIKYLELDTRLITTQLYANFATAMSLASLKVRADNFYDEDGEASTLAEMLRGILQPLALRMVQRSGRIFVYDLNGLYNLAVQRSIEWDGVRQTMGVDAVYNNAKITFNTYAQGGNLAPTTCWPDDIPVDKKLSALNDLDGEVSGDATYFSYYRTTDVENWTDKTDTGFTLWTAKRGKNATIDPRVNFFKIVPQYDGTEAEGVAISFKSYQGHYEHGTGWEQGMVKTKLYGKDFIYAESGAGTRYLGGEPLMITPKVALPPIENKDKFMLRVRLQMMFDPRFNPFESATNLKEVTKEHPQADWYKDWNTYGNYVYVPVFIKFQPTGSDKVYIWANNEIVSQDPGNPVTAFPETFGKWETEVWEQVGKFTIPKYFGWLAYYDKHDHASVSGALGWKNNRPATNPHVHVNDGTLINAEDGQYIPFPPHAELGGKLWVEVYEEGWRIMDGGTSVAGATFNTGRLWEKYSWILLKLPEIEIMNNEKFDQEITADDLEYNAELNSDAKEAIELETICGTSEEEMPTARGIYYNSENDKRVKELTRAGRTAQAEDLLIGTLYSQFAQRHTKLSGEAEISPGSVCTYKEANQPGKKFMIVGETQDLRTDCADTTYVEVRPDEYTRKN